MRKILTMIFFVAALSHSTFNSETSSDDNVRTKSNPTINITNGR